ncbi:hypothetical protein GFL91_23480 [Rhizobium leguminosarum bv. viciae]|jgi:hypothetical protein|uniref:Uncharacterized protein n=2 Tax=Rhizobium TaxID=379 RepID=A0AAJ3A6H1_9HYPH|nr:hypothetical protein [Rhizobium leguminosarum bv. viciae]NKM35551.1 hypothetical protein [Rhizobium laguerreae]NKL06450.1 hypothetical protein [Rhizobium leguminosarum bv. viciae]NKL84966.1 hypothetical protein [Rhizobium leguminosarum bv. viciae]NKL92575.1 hypothetical protein [Rhizobium leguminosarum bv. viciae]
MNVLNASEEQQTPSSLPLIRLPPPSPRWGEGDPPMAQQPSNHFLPAGAVFRIMRQAAPFGVSEDP